MPSSWLHEPSCRRFADGLTALSLSPQIRFDLVSDGRFVGFELAQNFLQFCLSLTQVAENFNLFRSDAIELDFLMFLSVDQSPDMNHKPILPRLFRRYFPMQISILGEDLSVFGRNAFH